jgi:hypothetical protein
MPPVNTRICYFEVMSEDFANLETGISAQQKCCPEAFCLAANLKGYAASLNVVFAE